MSSLSEGEKWVRQIVEEKLRDQRRRARETLRPIAEKRKRGERLTMKDVEKGMKILCFKHLAWCCGVEKKCGYRDSLLRALGLTKADYVEYKERCKRLLRGFLKKRGIT